MNIPEGWPTAKMIDAGAELKWREQFVNTHEECAEVFKTMLAAAPTPQELDVTEHRTIKDVIGEWLAGIVSSDNALEEIKAMCKAAPTAPAQEDEPVASVNSIRDSIGQGTINILKDGINPGDYLYTRPQSDELRKAVKEAIAIFMEASNTAKVPISIKARLFRMIATLKNVLEAK